MARNSILILFLLAGFAFHAEAQNWLWATSVNGPDTDEILTVATGQPSSVYIGGRYQDSIRFSSAVAFSGSPGYDQAFVARYDTSGTLVWARVFGGNRNDQVTAICTDDSGFVYMACYSRSTDPLVYDNFSFTGTGNDKTFLLKIDPLGNLVWGKLLTAGTSNAYPTSIAVKNGVVAITGNYAFLSLVIQTDTLTLAGNEDIFLAAWSAGTGNLLWTKALKSTGMDYARDVAMDSAANIYLTGIFNNSLSIGGVDTLFNPVGYETFLAKFNSAGTLMWRRRYYGTGDHMVNALATGPDGSLCIAGWHGSGNHELNDTSFNTLYVYNFWVQKVSPSGTGMWTKIFHGNSGGGIIGMVIDQASNVYLSGLLGSLYYFDTLQLTGGSTDVRAFIVKMSGSGTVLSGHTGGNRVTNTVYNNVASDAAGNVYTVGFFGSATGHQAVFGPDTLTSAGETDGYLAKYGLPTPCAVHSGFSYAQHPLCTGDSLQLINASFNSVSYQWFINGTPVSVLEHPNLVLTTAGNYTIKLVSTGLTCSDSSFQAITVNERWNLQLSDTFCNGDVYWFGGVPLTSSGTYVNHLTSAAGCDSTITLHLSMDSVVATFTITGDSALAPPGYGQYQWLDCDQGMAPVSGAVLPVFRPLQSGNYAVEIRGVLCADTSACQYILVIGAEEYPAQAHITLYPVPADNLLYVNGLQPGTGYEAQLTDLSGRILQTSRLTAGANSLDLHPIPPGLLLLRLTDDTGKVLVFRVVRR